MKKDFFDYMHEVMDNNKDVYFLMLGLGYPRVDEFLEKYPDRVFNLEASEQAGLDTAVGLAYAGKIPVVYSITPFLLYRGFETIRTYINHEHLPVVLVGVGRDDDYSKHDGFSHFAGDDWKLFHTEHQSAILDNITHRTALGTRGLQEMLDRAIEQKKPTYINIPR